MIYKTYAFKYFAIIKILIHYFWKLNDLILKYSIKI